MKEARLGPFESRAEELLAGLAPIEEGAAAAANGASSNGNGNGGGGEGGGVCTWMVDAIAGQEPQAERSLMHRFNTAHQVGGGMN